MKSIGNDTVQAMKPAPKGIRLPATTDLFVFIAEKTAQVNQAWNDADDIKMFWSSLDELGFIKKIDGDDEKYGERKFVGFPVRNNEFRISVVRKGSVVSIDLREWYL
jgi:hypothetical protein